MPTENRSSNTEQMVSLPMSTLEKCLRDARLVRFTCDKHVLHLQHLLAQPAVQHQVEPESSIPDGYCLMPRRLTTENGAKALLLGEFKCRLRANVLNARSSKSH